MDLLSWRDIFSFRLYMITKFFQPISRYIARKSLLRLGDLDQVTMIKIVNGIYYGHYFLGMIFETSDCIWISNLAGIHLLNRSQVTYFILRTWTKLNVLKKAFNGIFRLRSVSHHILQLKLHKLWSFHAGIIFCMIIVPSDRTLYLVAFLQVLKQDYLVKMTIKWGFIILTRELFVMVVPHFLAFSCICTTSFESFGLLRIWFVKLR